MADADIDGLKKHYTDLQILEMILSMAGNNSINRWKEGVGVPQSARRRRLRPPHRRRGSAPADTAAKPHSYLTPTSDRVHRRSITNVAPLLFRRRRQADAQTAS